MDIFLWTLILMTPLLIWNFYWGVRLTAKSRKRLAQWASARGLQIVQCERKHHPGPFGWIPVRGTIYLRFVANDEQYGKRRVGWASFDHSFWGEGQMDVRWGDK